MCVAAQVAAAIYSFILYYHEVCFLSSTSVHIWLLKSNPLPGPLWFHQRFCFPTVHCFSSVNTFGQNIKTWKRKRSYSKCDIWSLWMTAPTLGNAPSAEWEESLNPKATFRRIFAWKSLTWQDSRCGFALKKEQHPRGVVCNALPFCWRSLAHSPSSCKSWRLQTSRIRIYQRCFALWDRALPWRQMPATCWRLP